MKNLTAFLREQTLSNANKSARAPFPFTDVSALPMSLPERKATGLKKIFETMPLYIGEGELIVGTRTYLQPNESNENGEKVSEYSLGAGPKYITEQEIERFGKDQSYLNKTHYTPDFSIVLEKGINGILRDAEVRMLDPSLKKSQKEFLSSLQIAYTGLQTLILRYADHAQELASGANTEERERLLEIARICRKVSVSAPESFREAVQLLWFAHLGCIIESFQWICYGRLDVILGAFLGDSPRDEARQIVECLLLKMYDQADLNCHYVGPYSGQLVVTLGGVLADGSDAVNDVTFLFLDAIDAVRLPEPEFNLRISSKNPKEFLSRAAKLTVSGCNFVSYYNDDLFVQNLANAGIPIKYARGYAFDLCQDINIPGIGDFFRMTVLGLAPILRYFLSEHRDVESFDQLLEGYKRCLTEILERDMKRICDEQKHLFQYCDEEYEEYFKKIREDGIAIDCSGKSPMCPLPLLSGLYHGAIENAKDVIYECYPVKARGAFVGSAVETVNSLAAIRSVVFDQRLYTLEEVVSACEADFAGEDGERIRRTLWNAPKWGNDNDYVDLIAKDVLEFVLKEIAKYKTASGGAVLAGVHQPHPVWDGANLGATPEGRHAGTPIAVTLTAESGTAKNGPTAVLRSATKIDSSLVHWNFCVMVNYFSSVFQGNQGSDVFEDLLLGYFALGGLQHQPNVTSVEELRKARLEPEKYQDLIVRLWGISARFVDLKTEIQDEMIARFS